MKTDCRKNRKMYILSHVHCCTGDLKLVDHATRGGIEELRASADAIAKIAKKISGLHLGDKQVDAATYNASQLASYHPISQEGDAAVQELLQLGFIDPVTSATAGKRSVCLCSHHVPLRLPHAGFLSDTSTNLLRR